MGALGLCDPRHSHLSEPVCRPLCCHVYPRSVNLWCRDTYLMLSSHHPPILNWQLSALRSSRLHNCHWKYSYACHSSPPLPQVLRRQGLRSLLLAKRTRQSPEFRIPPSLVSHSILHHTLQFALLMRWILEPGGNYSCLRHRSIFPILRLVGILEDRRAVCPARYLGHEPLLLRHTAALLSIASTSMWWGQTVAALGQRRGDSQASSDTHHIRIVQLLPISIIPSRRPPNHGGVTRLKTEDCVV